MSDRDGVAHASLPKREPRDGSARETDGPLAIFTTKQGELVALDRQTGTQRMAFDFKVSINAQPIVAEGWMYLATGDGRVVALELGNPATMDGWHMWGGNAQHNL
ncbi:MAG: PQQ-binding-like beta-propeller repeat protein [Kofleriaceae bacterium]|nr:PQQ-binding-like beta-propeller repeat protein [Kofleriaceae bacterium]